MKHVFFLHVLLLPSWVAGFAGLMLIWNGRSARPTAVRASHMILGVLLVGAAVGCTIGVSSFWYQFGMPVSGGPSP